MSDTSITKGIEEEYSLDEEEPEEDNTSVALLSAARKSVNLPAVSNKTTNPALARITTVILVLQKPKRSPNQQKNPQIPLLSQDKLSIS